MQRRASGCRTLAGRTGPGRPPTSPVVVPSDDEPLAERYDLKETLGVGGAARVVLAWDQRLGVRRAVKLIAGQDGGAMRQQLRARLEREARAMAQLDHPNVLRIYDVGNADGQDFVVMDLAEGGSLAGWLQERGPMDPDTALRFMIQVLSALAAAHATGIVHRDVKPQNILLDRRGKALLADFGIAILEDDQRTTKTGMAMGSLAYMAPEQRLDARGVGPAADIYATGATLYHLLTRANPVDLFTAAPDSPRFHGVPGVLRDVIVRATRLTPEDRYASAREMAHDLAALLSSGTTDQGLDPSLFPEPASELMRSGAGLTELPAGPSGPATDDAITFLGDDFHAFRERVQRDPRGAGLTRLPDPDSGTLIPEATELGDAPAPAPSTGPMWWFAAALVGLAVVGAVTAGWPQAYVAPEPAVPTVLPDPIYVPGVDAKRVDAGIERVAARAAEPPFGRWRFTMNGRRHDLAVRGHASAVQATWTSHVGAGLDTPLTGAYTAGVLTLASDDGDTLTLEFDGATFTGAMAGVRQAAVLDGRRP